MQSSSRVCILVFDHAKLEQGVNICVSYFDRFLKNPEVPSSREAEFQKREAHEVYPLFFVSAMLLMNVCNYIYNFSGISKYYALRKALHGCGLE